jgi:hypothetical protein
MSGATSRAKSQLVLEHWRDFIFEFDGKILDWFNSKNFVRIEDFAILRDDDIDIIEYVDANGTSTPAPKRHKIRIKAAIGYYHYVHYYYNDDDSLDVLDGRNQINGETFDKFYVLEYDPSKDIIRYSREYIMKLEETQARLQRYRDHIDLIRLEIALLSYEKGEFDTSQAKSFLDEMSTPSTPISVMKSEHVCNKLTVADDVDVNDEEEDADGNEDVHEDDDHADADEDDDDDEDADDDDHADDDDDYADGDGNDDCGDDSHEDDNFEDSDSGYDEDAGKQEDGDDYIGDDQYNVHSDNDNDEGIDGGDEEIVGERNVMKPESNTTYERGGLVIRGAESRPAIPVYNVEITNEANGGSPWDWSKANDRSKKAFHGILTQEMIS